MLLVQSRVAQLMYRWKSLIVSQKRFGDAQKALRFFSINRNTLAKVLLLHPNDCRMKNSTANTRKAEDDVVQQISNFSIDKFILSLFLLQSINLAWQVYALNYVMFGGFSCTFCLSSWQPLSPSSAPRHKNFHREMIFLRKRFCASYYN